MSIVFVIIVLSILVFVHELGHFIMAKRAGMKVKEFGFGFPPRLFGIRRGETIYSLNWIPLGGFVSILGEDGAEADNPRSFAAGRAGTRFGVILAGVVMNILLAFILFFLLNSFLGAQKLFNEVDDSARIQSVQDLTVFAVIEDSPAHDAGFRLYDSIGKLNIDGQVFVPKSLEELQTITNNAVGSNIFFDIKRGDSALVLEAVPRVLGDQERATVGVYTDKTAIITFPLHIAIWQSIKDVVKGLRDIIIIFFILIRDLFAGQTAILDQVSGPVGITVVVGRFAELGFAKLIHLSAFLSLNLAILNALPIPPLDGGKMFFILVEKLEGKPLNKKIETVIATIGLVLLLALVIYATIGDISRFT